MITNANTFIDEKLSLVDENFHLHHITGYVNEIIHDQYRELYAEMKDKYGFKEPQDVLLEIKKIYADYHENYIDFIKYASSCYVMLLLSEGFEIFDISNRKELQVGLPRCEIVYPSIEMDKIWRKEKEINDLKIKGFNKVPIRPQHFLSAILFDKNNTQIDEFKQKYKFEIVGQDERWIATNMAIKYGDISSIDKICRKTEKPVIGLYCYASMIFVIKIYEEKVISIYLESKAGLLEASYLPNENENLERIKEFLIPPYTYDDLLKAVQRKEEHIEDVGYEILEMIGVSKELFNKQKNM